MVFDKVSFDEVISMLSESSVISTKIYSFGIINIPPSSPTGFFYIFIFTYFLYKAYFTYSDSYLIVLNFSPGSISVFRRQMA
jgi:hypothetical protein